MKVRFRHASLLSPLVLVLLLLGLGVASPVSAATNRSCGTVSAAGGGDYRVTVSKGSPSCATVRAVAAQYGQPQAVRYSCPTHDHICSYGVYSGGWRCTGLFQGNYGCWLGGDAKGNNARQGFKGQLR